MKRRKTLTRTAAVILALSLGLGTMVARAQFEPRLRNSDDIDFRGHISVRSDVFEVRDQLDSTKKLKFNASGITTNTTRTVTLPDASGTMALTDGSTFTNATLTDPTLTRTSQKRIYSTSARVGATAGWVTGASITTDTGELANLPDDQTDATLVVPISGLHVGDVITGFHLIGNIVSAGTSDPGTLDADLRYLTASASAPNDGDLGTMAQVSVGADTALTSANTTGNLSVAHTVAADETYYLLLTATTGTNASIVIQGAAITYTEH